MHKKTSAITGVATGNFCLFFSFARISHGEEESILKALSGGFLVVAEIGHSFFAETNDFFITLC